jgi:hypothetical protein
MQISRGGELPATMGFEPATPTLIRKEPTRSPVSRTVVGPIWEELAPLTPHCGRRLWIPVRGDGALGESGVHPVEPYGDPAGPGCGSMTTRAVSDGRNAA